MERYVNNFPGKIVARRGIGIPGCERCLELTGDSGSLTLAITRRSVEPRGSRELCKWSVRSFCDRTGLSIKENHSLGSLHERSE